MQLTVVHETNALQETLAGLARQGKRVALVPTMGALHAGHMALIAQAARLADVVAVSIFVNPKQFGPKEDFGKYPRMLEEDMEKVAQAGGHMVYAPTAVDMYPDGFSTKISIGPLGEILEGQFRPGFFDGVATVVTKLLIRTLPHVAVFGEKDYQQLCVIRRLVADLDLPIEIEAGATVREGDGLALSSRNAYLSPQERQIAPKLYEILHNTGAVIASGTVPVHAALDHGRAALAGAGFRPDYLELRAAETLEAMDALSSPARLLVAAWLGTTRLIDNIAVE